MDELVLQAMVRWPNVPAAWGWLRLDRRGQWFIIERSAPDFTEQTHGLGSIVRNERLLDFIARNYEQETDGAWYFQNGPQRVFVDLELAPLILRIDNQSDSLTWVTHTGDYAYQTLGAAVDILGNVYIKTERGVGVIDDRHLSRIHDWLIERADGQLELMTRRDPRKTIAVSLDTEPAQLWGYQKTPREPVKPSTI